MGTLFNQEPRQHKLDSYVNTIARILERDLGKDPDNTTPEWWVAAAKVAEAATRLQNADCLDEQLAGFGEILQDAVSHMKDHSGIEGTEG